MGQRISYFLRGLMMFVLCGMNLQMMTHKPINLLFGVVPFLIAGLYQLYLGVRVQGTAQ